MVILCQCRPDSLSLTAGCSENDMSGTSIAVPADNLSPDTTTADEPDWAALGFESPVQKDQAKDARQTFPISQTRLTGRSIFDTPSSGRDRTRLPRIGSYSSADWFPKNLSRSDSHQQDDSIEASGTLRRAALVNDIAIGDDLHLLSDGSPASIDVLHGNETDASLPPPSTSVPRRSTSKAYRIQRRLERIGRGTKYIQTRLVPNLHNERCKIRPTSPQQPVDPSPSPNTFLADLYSRFPGAVKLIEAATRHHNATGELLPPHVLPLFERLIDPKEAITAANIIRGHFDLPTLGQPTDQIALRRAMARTRERLYGEIASALILPEAPPPGPASVNGDEDQEIQKPLVQLTTFSLEVMKQRLPIKFGKDKAAIRAFLSNPEDAYGEQAGQVVWERGVGSIKGAPGGFAGKVLDTEGLLHVFVDHSNVLHGLLHTLYNAPPDALPPRHLRTLSLPCLSLLLRRGRHTPPGSLHLVASSPLKQNLDPLVCLGWEVSILKRVEVYEEEVVDATATKLVDKPISQPNATHTGLRRYREQGVDEILHLKLLLALNQKETPAPKGSTVVLATGDAKGGQFNRDGFLGAVREALKRGWSVELWSFKAGEFPIPQRQKSID